MHGGQRKLFSQINYAALEAPHQIIDSILKRTKKCFYSLVISQVIPILVANFL